MAEDQTIGTPRPVSRSRPIRDPEYIPLGVRRLRVMLSGRGETKIGDLTLGEIRNRIGRRLTNGPWLGGPSFDVDVNTSHDAPTESWWEESRRMARECHVFIGFYTGEAGTPDSRGTIGICAAEWLAARDSGPDKVMGLDLRMARGEEEIDEAERRRNQQFANLVSGHRAWLRMIPTKPTYEQIESATLELLSHAVTRLAGIGSRAERRAAFARGEALEWSRASFAERAQQMLVALAGAVGGITMDAPDRVAVQGSLRRIDIARASLLAWLHAVPGAFGVAAARERIARPFAREVDLEQVLRAHGLIGPLHVIAVHRGVTESQLASFFGTPDIYVAAGRFGFYAADLTTLQQAIVLADCRDPLETDHQWARAADWLESVGEDKRLIEIANRRAAIVHLLAAQVAEMRTGKGATLTRRRSRRKETRVGP
jgi:hypothetical protein